MDLCDAGQVKALLARRGFHFSKSMGQNFLIADWVPRDIAQASGAGEGCGVLEVGPGIGVLTRELAARADRVVSVELDRALLPILEETLAGYGNAEVVPGDILRLNLPRLAEEKFSGLKALACANLPYNITTPAITALIEAGCFSAVTVMIQREVARRICAAPGSRDYGAFSVYCQYHTRPELLFEVPPSCFLPAPKVTSAVLRMIPREAPEEVEDPEYFFRVVRAAFAQRRKTLLNCLTAAYSPRVSREALSDAVVRCGLREDVRGERLGIGEFAALARALKELEGQ